jgi:ATP-binding cassette subfamily B protein
MRDWHLYRRLLGLARPYWAHISGIFLLGLLAIPIALLTPVPLKIAVDNVIGGKPLPSWLAELMPGSQSQEAVLVLAVVLVLLTALMSQLQLFLTSVLGAYTSEQLQLRFRSLLFRHGQRLSLAYHDSRGTADSLYRIQWDAPAIQWVAVYGVTPFVSAALTLGGMLYVTARLDPELALVALAVCPFLVILSWIARRRLRPVWRETKKLETSALSVVQEAFGALRVVKSFGQEDRETERFTTRSRAGVRARIGLAAAQGTVALLVGLTLAAGTAVVLFLGVRGVEHGTLTLGSLLLIMGYLTQLYVPLQTVTNSIATLQSSLASAERAFSLLDEPTDVPDHPHARALDRARGAIEFRNASFAYQEGQDVLGRQVLGHRRRAGRNRRPNRRRKVDSRQPADQVLRSELGLDPPRRNRPALLPPRRSTQPVRNRPAGFDPLLADDRREHRVRPAGREPDGDCRGGESGRRARVHQCAP